MTELRTYSVQVAYPGEVGCLFSIRVTADTPERARERALREAREFVDRDPLFTTGRDLETRKVRRLPR